MTVQLLIGVIGIGVTALVGVGMIYLTPRYTVEVHVEGEDPHGSSLSPVPPEDRVGDAARR